MGGVEAARRIKALRPRTVVALVSLEEPDDVSATASASGAVAFVRKQEFGPSTLRGLWLVHGRDWCGDLDALLEAIERERPDVVLTDIRMPPTNTEEGIRLAARLRESHPGHAWSPAPGQRADLL
jgi:CheY-like chemotaxis protein